MSQCTSLHIEGSGQAIETEIAVSVLEKARGLLGRPSLDKGKGLLIHNCSSIHTMFMRFPIDVVYLDGSMTVRGIREGMRPFRLSFCPGADSVLELAAGEARRCGIKKGDILLFGGEGKE